jgi:hypothetical protein
MARQLRAQRHTILIVHEGYAEGCLLTHLRTIYQPRNAALALTLRNARGGGGRHALDLALRMRRRSDFDEVTIFVDTDQDWDEAQRRRANASHIDVVESSPCLEAWLLQVNGHAAQGNGDQLKRDFLRHYGGAAHNDEIYARHFPRAALDAARLRLETLDRLLRLMRA